MVQLTTEEKILEINQMNEMLIVQIDEYEKETITRYQTIKDSLKTVELDALKINLNSFINETQEYEKINWLLNNSFKNNSLTFRYLNNFRINDTQVKISNERARIHKSNLLREIKKFKLALFGNKIMSFVVF